MSNLTVEKTAESVPVRIIKYLYIFLFLFSVPLFADEKEEEKVVILPVGTVHNGDYFAWGSSVEISGTVNGDVYVCAEQVVIDGQVNGDVLGVGGSIDIPGDVSHNCRLVAGQVLISGRIGRNVTAVSGNLQLLSSASLGGSIVAVAGNADLAAKINADATLIASNLRLASFIKRNVLAYVGQLRLTSKAVIGGDLDYRTNTPLRMDSGAVVNGAVTRHPSFVHELVEGTWVQSLLVGSKVLAVLMNILYTFVIGVIILKIFPQNLEAALASLKRSPFKSLSYGIMLLVLLPLASLLLLMTILGVPFALTLMALNVIYFYTAKIYCIFWGSNWAFGKMGMKPNRLPSFFLGLLIYFSLTAIPIFGTILAFAAMLFGVGAGALAQTKRSFFKAK